MPIASPVNSFVDFNEQNLDCRGNARDVALPVYETFDIKFQIYISDDEKKPKTELLYAAVCTEACSLLYENSIPVVSTCDRYVIQSTGGVALLSTDFPIIVLNSDHIPAGSYDQRAFFEALKDLDATVQALDYISCCPPTSVDLDIDISTAGGANYTLELGVYWGYGYVEFPVVEMAPYVGFNECFRYCILNAANEVQSCSNLFYSIIDPCYTTVFTYRNEENAYGFKYSYIDEAGDPHITENQIRLSVFFDKPTRPVEENIFRRSDKVQQRLSTLIEKEWLGHTSYLSDDQHDKFIVMLKHDTLHVYHENRNMDRNMTQEGEVEYIYPDINNPKTYPATFRIKDYNYSYVNNNCGFNCGIEINDECDNGTAPPCPDKYFIEFTVGDPGSPMANGDTVYSDAALSQAVAVEVYREGLLQHESGVNNITFVRGANPSQPGVITFTPEVITGERIAIWEL